MRIVNFEKIPLQTIEKHRDFHRRTPKDSNFSPAARWERRITVMSYLKFHFRKLTVGENAEKTLVRRTRAAANEWNDFDL